MRALLLVLVFAAAAVPSISACRQACPAALVSGVLVEQDGELLVQRPAGGEPQRLVFAAQWPHYRLSSDGNTLVIADFFGRIHAREGDAVEIGGGETETRGWLVCGSVEVVDAGPT